MCEFTYDMRSSVQNWKLWVDASNTSTVVFWFICPSYFGPSVRRILVYVQYILVHLSDIFWSICLSYFWSIWSAYFGPSVRRILIHLFVTFRSICSSHFGPSVLRPFVVFWSICLSYFGSSVRPILVRLPFYFDRPILTILFRPLVRCRTISDKFSHRTVH